MSLIDIQNLWKRFGKDQVLKGLSLQILKGETIVILGRSGVGKSVLLKQIIGLDKPDKGFVKISGVDISGLHGQDLYKVTKNMGMLFQGSALFDSMNIAENTAFYLNQHGDWFNSGEELSKSEIEDRVAEALDMVGLSGTQEKMPSDLSGGMKKRAALARLIVYRPSILLYDEPTTGLDPITAMHINEMIMKIQHELNVTSVVVTHDIASALKIADRLALHHDGIISHVAKKEDFRDSKDPLIENFFEYALVKEKI